jgi:predicted nucleic acid-binding protein
VITRAEVLAGFDSKSAIPTKQLLDFFPTIPITKEDADAAAELRRIHRWKLPDALQIAISRNHRLKFATRNIKDFDPQQHNFILIPYQL